MSLLVSGIDMKMATSIARLAAKVPSRILRKVYSAGGTPYTSKTDGSLVSDVDLEVERKLRDIFVEIKYPDGASVLGEEDGERENTSRWRWIIDPIDGTHPFLRRIPTFATLVALQDQANNEILTGAVHFPALNRTYWASKGGGAFCNDLPIRISERSELQSAMVGMGTPKQFRNSGIPESMQRLLGAVDDVRSFGDAFGHMLTAQGSLDAVFDPDLAIWDFAPSRIIIDEAGGSVLVRETGRGRGHDVLLGSSAIVEQLAELLEF